MSAQTRFQQTIIPNQILFIGSKYSRKELVFAKLCGLSEEKDYTIFPEKGVYGNIYINLIPSVELYNTQEVISYIEAAVFDEFSKIKRIFFIVELKFDWYSNTVRIEEFNNVVKVLQQSLYNQHISFILTYQNSEKKQVLKQYNEQQYITYNNLQYKFILVNTDELEALNVINIIMKQIQQILLESSIIEFKLGPNIDCTNQTNQIKQFLNTLDHKTFQDSSILQLEQYIIFLKYGMFQNLRNYNSLFLYQIQQCCKAEVRSLIKSKISLIINLIDEKAKTTKLENILQCNLCKKLVDKSQSNQYCYQLRIFDNQDPPEIFQLNPNNNNIYSAFRKSKSICKFYSKYGKISEDEISLRRNYYLERIKSHLSCFFDPKVHQDDSQQANEVSLAPEPKPKALYQVLLLGKSDFKNIVFRKLCGPYNQQECETVFPKQSWKPFKYQNFNCNIFFHLAPNLISFREVEKQTLIDSVIYGSQELDAILIFIDAESEQQDTQNLKKLLQLYNKNIIFVICNRNYQKIELPCPTIHLDLTTFDPQLFQEQLLSMIIKFPQPLTTCLPLSDQDKQQLEPLRPKIMILEKFIKSEKFQNLSIQGVESLYYYIFTDFLKDSLKTLPIYQQQLAFSIDTFVYLQMVRQYYKSLITEQCKHIINRLQESLKCTNEKNVKTCQYCQNLIYNSNNIEKVICANNRILTENRQPANVYFILKQTDYSIVELTLEKYENENSQCTQPQSWNIFKAIDEQTLKEKISNFFNRILLFQNSLRGQTCQQQTCQQQTCQQQALILNNEQGKQEKPNSQIINSQQQQQQIILIGQSGVGKTSIFNKLCNINQRIQYTLNNQTKKFPKGSIKGLTVFDTPAFDVRDEEGASNFQLIDQFASFFSQIKVNQIFILANYERLAQMKKKIDECYNPLRKFKNMITFIITKMDNQIENPEKIQELENKLKQSYGKQTKFILYGNQVSSEELQRYIYQTLQDTQQQALDLSDTMFDINSQSESGRNFVQGLNQISYQLTQGYIQEQEDKIQQRIKNKEENENEIERLGKMIKEYKTMIEEAEQQIQEKKQQNKQEDEAINNSNKQIKEYKKKLSIISKDNPQIMKSQIYGVK